MKIIDILSPVGGKHGGVENVIKLWTKHLNNDEFRVRVFHMTPGIRYLFGYPYAYDCAGLGDRTGAERDAFYVAAYRQFVQQFGAPDVCIATNWPLMSKIANIVRTELGSSFPIVSWLHSNLERYAESDCGGMAELLCADAHFVINETTKNKILAQAPAARVYFIGNPIVKQSYREFTGGENVICYVGRLSVSKRVDILLEALYRAKSKWRLLLVGTGEMEEELKKIAAYLELGDQVEFLGWQENPWEACDAAAAFVTATEYEGFPLSVIEALAKGMMVISTPVDGVVDVIKPGVNGYLFAQENAAELAQILDYLDEGQLYVCASSACADSVARFEEEAYFAKVKQCLEELV